MVKRLNDDDTKMEILSKVTKMTLEDTITFIEARETGSKSATALSKNVMASTLTNVVEAKSDVKCTNCGETGHWTYMEITKGYSDQGL